MKARIVLLLSLLSVLIFSCKKNETIVPAGSGTMNVYLTDAPANYDSVVVNITAVTIKGDGDDEMNLNVQGGFYNLLDLTNDANVLLATGQVTSRNITQIRLILGEGNYIVSNGQKYPLKTPSAQESGLKIKVNGSIGEGGTYNVLVDFDAGQSIVKQGNGDFLLKPVLRGIDVAATGSVKGFISPAFAHASIVATGPFTYGTFVSNSGGFMLQGVAAGTYTLTLTPNPPLTPVIINNVIVVNGEAKDMGNITPNE